MNVKTMEGLAGASASIRMISTPMSVADEAERKGDTDKMQRALGYAAGLTEQAADYGEKASEGMKLDAREAKEKEKLQQKELVEARIKEREEQEKRIEAKRQEDADPDTVEISEEGRAQVEMSGSAVPASADSVPAVGYDEPGGAVKMALEIGDNVDVSV